MSNLLEHMENEFRVAGLNSGTDPVEEMIVSGVRALMNAFISQGLSDGGAATVLPLFDRLTQLKPLTPLTGARSEWLELPADPTNPEGPTHINVRCPTVFRYTDGAYDVGAVPIYVDPFGHTTRSTDKPPRVQFPYMPGFPPVIPVDADGNPIRN